MVKAGADRLADMTLHGQLAIKQDAKVADNVSRFHDGRTDFQCTVFRFSRLREDREPNQISSIAIVCEI